MSQGSTEVFIGRKMACNEYFGASPRAFRYSALSSSVFGGGATGVSSVLHLIQVLEIGGFKAPQLGHLFGTEACAGRKHIRRTSSNSSGHFRFQQFPVKENTRP